MTEHLKRGKYREEDRVIVPSLVAIEKAYEILLAFPDEDTARWYRVEDHQKVVTTEDLQEGFLHLFGDVYNWLKFFWWTSTFKARQLIEALIQCYNNDQFLAWLILARSSLEYAAVTYYFVRRINQLQLKGPSFAFSQIESLEKLMLQYAHGSRFNWSDLLTGNKEGFDGKLKQSESMSAVNVLTALDHLVKRDARYRDARIAYDMLSDFAHSNMASHASVVDMQMKCKQMHECQIAVHPSSMRGEFIMVVSLPWVSLGEYHQTSL